MYARSVLDQHDFEIVNAATDVASLEILASVSEIPMENFSFESGWAKTKAHGTKYGRKYIDPFKEEIQEMFDAGNVDPAQKKGPRSDFG